jgi:hypothetical protein
MKEETLLKWKCKFWKECACSFLKQLYAPLSDTELEETEKAITDVLFSPESEWRLPEIEKYKKILSEKTYIELSKAVVSVLQTHGYGWKPSEADIIPFSWQE